jgi:DeoR/GlpR family transcriptional regulator of sugar metabolism
MPGRRDLMLSMVRQEGFASVQQLRTLAKVSVATARRDIRILAAEGLVEPIHGGARRPAPRDSGAGRPSHVLTDFVRSEVHPGMTIGICGSRLAGEVAVALAEVADLRVVTNSLAVWQCANVNTAIGTSLDLILVPGELSRRGVLTGMLAIASVERFRYDLVFVCGSDFSESTGLAAPDLAEAAIDRSFIAGAGQVAVVTHSHVQGDNCAAIVCEGSEIDAVLDLAVP